MKPLVRAVPDIFWECLNDPCWKGCFLHTLSHALYISEHPFTDWTLGSSTLLETIQVVFNISFTNITYTFRLQDRIVKAVRLM